EVHQGATLTGDCVVVDFVGQRGFEEGSCFRGQGCVAYHGQESLTFNGVPGNVLVEAKKSMDTAKYALSPSSLRDEALSQKIISCGRFLAKMLGSSSFQDDPSCH